MIIHSVKCEMCDTKHDFSYTTATWRELPSGWLTLFSGDGNLDGWHFCSDKCLVQWVTGNVTQEERNKPPCKMRRFVLSEKSGACETEGVMWPGGPIVLDYSFGHGSYHCSGKFSSWDYFSESHSDHNVIWIDKEPEA